MNDDGEIELISLGQSIFNTLGSDAGMVCSTSFYNEISQKMCCTISRLPFYFKFRIKPVEVVNIPPSLDYPNPTKAWKFLTEKKESQKNPEHQQRRMQVYQA